MASFQVVVNSRLTDSQSLRNKLIDLEDFDEQRQATAQHIKALQQQRNIIFGKRHKKRALQSGMMVMIQDGKKLEFPCN